MDYEKKYNEAQKWIESIYTELNHERQMEAEAFFPELKENEDERIRKDMIIWLKGFIGEASGVGYTENEIKERIAWLEKQGDKNPTWSEEDMNNLDNIIWLCDNCIKNIEYTWIPSQASKIKSLIERIKDNIQLCVRGDGRAK